VAEHVGGVGQPLGAWGDQWGRDGAVGLGGRGEGACLGSCVGLAQGLVGSDGGRVVRIGCVGHVG